jgi:YihY family inner membrane protein
VLEALLRSLVWPQRVLRFTARVAAAFLGNRGILLAGGVGYNALLSVVPFLVLLVSALSLVVDEARILAVLRAELAQLVPQQADTILGTARTFLETKATTNAVSVALLLFFSSIAFRMLEEAVAAIFHTSLEHPRRRFWVSAALPYLFMVVLAAGLFAMTFVTHVLDALGEQSLRVLGVNRPLGPAAAWAATLLNFAGLVLLFGGVYRVLPVVRVSNRRALAGGLFAAVLWRLLARSLVYYFTNVSLLPVIYGSLASVIVVLLYLEIVFVILLLGAQAIAELEASASAGLPWWERPRGRVVHRGR